MKDLNDMLRQAFDESFMMEIQRVIFDKYRHVTKRAKHSEVFKELTGLTF
jgi:hypothetical protein